MDGNLKASSNYNQTSNPIEINFSGKTVITELNDKGHIPQNHFEVVKIKDIENKADNKVIDLIAIVGNIGETQNITMKNGQQKEQKKIQLNDETGSIEMTFWGDSIKKIDFNEGQIVLVQGAMVKSFRGKCLNSLDSTAIFTEVPDIQEYRDLL